MGFRSLLVLIFGLPALTEAAPLRVTATTTMAADLVRSIGGEDVVLTGLMNPGVDPHLYKPTRRDILSLERAQVIIYNGLHLEGRMTDVLEKMGRRGRIVIALGSAIGSEHLLAHPDYEGAYDPHIWFDPSLWRECVPLVVEALSKAAPEKRTAFSRRGEAVTQELAALAAWGRERIERLDPQHRVLITSHDAYNYFGRAFGFQVIGVQGISTVTEAGLADITQVIDFIKARKIKAVFVESSVSPRTIQRISQDSGAVVGGELFSDAMGEPGDRLTVAGETYDVGTFAGMFKHNVNTIVEALR
jgi:manganese/zinc/iron transport system substrate-binding protein